MSKKSVYVLYTGGTIGMKQTPQGLVPDDVWIKQTIGEFGQDWAIELDILSPLIDSSSITMAHWQDWIRRVRVAQQKHDAILILHGTDTLAYTSSLFSCIFGDNATPPIILTGAQKAPCMDNSDALGNLQSAFSIFKQDFQGVAVVFNCTLWNAFNLCKVSTQKFDAFLTPHQDALGFWQGQEWQINAMPKSYHQITLDYQNFQINPDLKIVSLYLLPGFTLEQSANTLANQDFDAVILQSYGNGNVPPYPTLMQAIQKCTQAGKIVVNISQVLQGQVHTVYKQNQSIVQAGAINGGLLTPEGALARLVVSLSCGLSFDKLKGYIVQESH